jgi:hypothetical protein
LTITLRQQWETLYAGIGQPTGVDRDSGIIRGVVIAQAGNFKTGRGSFDVESLRQIVRLAAAQRKGLRSRFKHANLAAGEDALDRFLGRVMNARLSTAMVERGGKMLEVPCVRGDLHLSPVAMQSPPTGGQPYGKFVMSLAESDSEAIAMSLVLRSDKVAQRNGPPLWYPTALDGVDVVGVGDATDGLLGGEDFAREALHARWRNRKRQVSMLDSTTSREILFAQLRNRKRRFELGLPGAELPTVNVTIKDIDEPQTIKVNGPCNLVISIDRDDEGDNETGETIRDEETDGVRRDHVADRDSIN